MPATVILMGYSGQEANTVLLPIPSKLICENLRLIPVPDLLSEGGKGDAFLSSNDEISHIVSVQRMQQKI